MGKTGLLVVLQLVTSSESYHVRILVEAMKSNTVYHYTKVPTGSNNSLICPLNILTILYFHQPVPYAINVRVDLTTSSQPLPLTCLLIAYRLMTIQYGKYIQWTYQGVITTCGYVSVTPLPGFEYGNLQTT